MFGLIGWRSALVASTASVGPPPARALDAPAASSSSVAARARFQRPAILSGDSTSVPWPSPRGVDGCSTYGLPLDRGVHLVEQCLAVGEVEVLREVPVDVLTRVPVQRHVERDQPRSLEILVAAGGAGRRLGFDLRLRCELG